MGIVFRDLLKSLKLWRIWVSLAYEDLQDRYRQASLGMLWISLTYIAFVMAYIFIFERMIVLEKGDFRVYLLFGWAAWQFISGCITDGAQVFPQSRGIMMSRALPYYTYFFRVVLRNLIVFVIMMLTALAASQFFQFHWSWNQLTIFPALLVYFITGVWVCALVGPIVARLNDLNHIIGTFMRISFFMTPIIWYPGGRSQALRQFAQYNPFYHYIELIRSPVVFNEIHWESWIFVGGATAVIILFGSLSYVWTRRLIPFWV